MSKRSFEIIGALSVIVGVFVLLWLAPVPVKGQAPTAAAKTAAVKTPWGEADLQGIWSDGLGGALERTAGGASEFYTEKESAELDHERTNGTVVSNQGRD